MTSEQSLWTTAVSTATMCSAGFIQIIIYKLKVSSSLSIPDWIQHLFPPLNSSFFLSHTYPSCFIKPFFFNVFCSNYFLNYIKLSEYYIFHSLSPAGGHISLRSVSFACRHAGMYADRTSSKSNSIIQF